MLDETDTGSFPARFVVQYNIAFQQLGCWWIKLEGGYSIDFSPGYNY